MRKNELTIVTPCYNSAQYLERTFSSICEQAGVRVTWLIIDDASSDGTPALIRSLASRRNLPITIVSHFLPENHGPAYATSVGIRRVATEFFSFLDSDDWLEPGGIEQLVEKLVSQPEVGLVYGQKRWFSEDEQTYVTPFFPNCGVVGDPFLQLIRGQFVASGQYVVRTRHAVAALGGRLRLNGELHGQNLQLLLPLAASVPFRFFPIPTVNYRVRRDSVSHAPHLHGVGSVIERHQDREATIAYCMSLVGRTDDYQYRRVVARLMDSRLYRELQRHSLRALVGYLARDIINRPRSVLFFIVSQIQERLQRLANAIKPARSSSEEPIQ